MINWFPSDIDEKSDQYWKDSSFAEKEFFEHLKKLNGNKWTIMHGNPVQAPSEPKSNKGPKKIMSDMESDFIIVNPDLGLLFVEVKGGLISTKDGIWQQEVLFGHKQGQKIRLAQSPADQSKKAMYGLLNVLKNNISSENQPYNRNWWPFTQYCVAFPYTEIPFDLEYLDPETHRDIVIAKNDLPEIQIKIEEIFKYYQKQPLGEEKSDLVIRTLKPSTTFEKSHKVLHKLKHEAVRKSIQTFTEDQIRMFSRLKRNSRLRVLGGPGTGKTILGIERAKQLDHIGNKVLFTCLNTLLRSSIAVDLAETQVIVKDFQALCIETIQEADLIHLPDTTKLDELASYLPESAEQINLKFDAIIIDEGQDFTPKMLESLEFLLEDSKDGFFYIFADKKQDLWNKSADLENANDFGPIWELDRNVRNSKLIAEKINNIFDTHDETIDEDGPEPIFLDSTHPVQTKSHLSDQVEALLMEGYSHKEIVILCWWEDIDEIKETLSSNSYLIEHKIAEEMNLESVRRFKGLESEAVILVLPLNWTRAELTHRAEEVKKMAYTGISRPTTQLVVIGPHHTLQREINWGGESTDWWRR